MFLKKLIALIKKSNYGKENFYKGNNPCCCRNSDL